MLSQSNRLRSKKDIERVFKRGQRFKEGPLLLKALKNDSNISRIGFVVSQKVAKEAVSRNKIKRRLRALIGGQIKNIKEGIDLLFIALPESADQDYLHMNESINKLLIKTGCLKNNS